MSVWELENKAMEKQHQRECEHEQHEFRMLQMRMMISQNRQGASVMQSQNPPSFEGFGLMAELQSELPLTPYSI